MATTKGVAVTVEATAKAAGYKQVDWLVFTKVLLYIQLCLSFLADFNRPDQVTLTVCVITIYFVHNNDKLQRSTFRVVVGLMFLSLIYDMLWFWLSQPEVEMDGGFDDKFRKTIMVICYVSFFFKVSDLDF